LQAGGGRSGGRGPGRAGNVRGRGIHPSMARGVAETKGLVGEKPGARTGKRK